MRNEYEYTKAERINAILDELAARLGITPEDLRVEPEPLAADASPRQIAGYFFEAGLLRSGAWRRSTREAWQPLDSAQHARAALEILIDADVDADVAARVEAHLDLCDPHAASIRDTLRCTAMQEGRMPMGDADRWARLMTARRLPR